MYTIPLKSLNRDKLSNINRIYAVNIFFIYFQFPSVVRPQTLPKRYHGILSGVLIDFMEVWTEGLWVF